jgi:hypothetical protein
MAGRGFLVWLWRLTHACVRTLQTATALDCLRLGRIENCCMTTWILQHPGKRCIRKTIEDAILSDEKSA